MSQLSFEGFPELKEKLAALPFLARDVVSKALIVGAGMIEESAKNNVRDNDSVVTGNLFQSIGSVPGTTPEGEPFVMVGSHVAYAANYEFGMAVGDGDFDSPDFERKMLEWGAMKGLDTDTTEAIIAHIRKHGTKPHPFLGPALAKHLAQIEVLISRAVDLELKRAGGPV